MLKSLSKILPFVLIIALSVNDPCAAQDKGQSEGNVAVDIIRQDHSVTSLTLEVATTPAQQQYGLMYREDLADGYGMLFLFKPARIVSMWMKNTPLSLDMIFITPDNKIDQIETGTMPYSLDLISSHNKIKAVIEIKAGSVQKLQLAVGDQVVIHTH